MHDTNNVYIMCNVTFSNKYGNKSSTTNMITLNLSRIDIV